MVLSFWGFLVSHTGNVKALQGLGMLGMSVMLCVQGSVVQWFEVSDEGVNPNWTEDEKEQWICKI